MAIRFGSGSLAFELVEGWERIPNDWTHPDVAGVCTDSSGNVFLYCRGDHPVMIYDREGNFLDSWGDGMFSFRTHGMHMGGEDRLFLVDDGGNSVGQYSLDGKLIQQIGPKGDASDTGYTGEMGKPVPRAAGPFNHPTNLAVAPSGDYYVSDGYGNSRVHRFSEDGDLIQSWGEPGSKQGEFVVPHGVWVHDDGRVFVADRENDRIQIFGPTGEFLTEWLDLQRPQDIYISDGLVYVGELLYRKGSTSLRRGPIAEEEPGRLSIFDMEGNCLLRWSDPDPTKDGYFIAPHGLWVDDEGSIYMAEVNWTMAVNPGLAPADVHTFQKFARA
ncbi:MAG: peptidyl-alpha-hydroxyglycine alpha-amidating lyase family protein [Acidimicrobiaceae bacterium]|nr:peptidyl-alpha-hydroxyglycine alpha-amidating lyase family protein [Acidimicrobiaceae bacterium]